MDKYTFSGTQEQVSKVGAWFESQGLTNYDGDVTGSSVTVLEGENMYIYLNFEPNRGIPLPQYILDDIFNDGWHVNTGEAPTIPEGCTLDVKFNYNKTSYDTWFWNWDCGDNPCHISHYRFIKQPAKVHPTKEKIVTFSEAAEMMGVVVQQPPIDAVKILQDAANTLVSRAVERDKGERERSMLSCVTAFNALTKHTLTEEQGWIFMAVLKAARSQGGQFKLDDYLDGAAYFALAGEAAGNA